MWEEDYKEEPSHQQDLIDYLYTILDEFYEPDKIPENERLHPDPLIDGLMYIYKKDNKEKTSIHDYYFEHDKMYVMVDFNNFSKKDCLHLYRLGFSIDPETDGFTHG